MPYCIVLIFQFNDSGHSILHILQAINHPPPSVEVKQISQHFFWSIVIPFRADCGQESIHI